MILHTKLIFLTHQWKEDHILKTEDNGQVVLKSMSFGSLNKIIDNFPLHF